MKKTYLLLPVSLLSVMLGASLASASNAAFTVSLQGDVLALAPTSINTNLDTNIYRDGKDDSENNKIEASDTIQIENNSGSDTENKENGSSDEKVEANFQINGDQERLNDRGLFISDMAQVHTGKELHLFVQALVHNNQDVKEVRTQEDRVSVTRTVPTRLLGFIPFSTQETAEIISHGDGTEQVTVSRSWWNIFSKDEIATDIISNEIKSRIKDMPASEFKATLGVTTKARLISEIQAAFIANSSASSTVTY